jgi:NAD(P)-dependent dehydrogenase (short-subunit alcohol dehydrogenase family)
MITSHFELLSQQMKDIFSLDNNVAIVVGASGALGSAIAEGFAAFGADVVLVGRTLETLEKTTDLIRPHGHKIMIIQADATDQKQVESLVQRTISEFGKIDILVNAQGTNIRKPTDVITLVEWEKVVDQNLKSVFLTCQAVGKEMIKQRSGKILNIASLAATVGYDKGYSAYAPSKAGVIALTKTLAAEWGKYNISINALAPFFIRSRLTEGVLNDKSFYEWIMSNMPMKVVGSPKDVVGAALLFCSKTSNWITGQVLCIDGGRSVT